jgi:hypothetical protein
VVDEHFDRFDGGATGCCVREKRVSERNRKRGNEEAKDDDDVPSIGSSRRQ